MARLPQPGGDDGNWGDILNSYLSTTLQADGSLKDDTVTAAAIADNAVATAHIQANAVTEAQLAAGVQTKLNQAQSGAVSSVAGQTGAVTLTKTDVGLANVDNTTDANKPVSTATANAIAASAGAGLTLIAKTVNYTLASGEIGCRYNVLSSGAVTVTVPVNATVGIPVGSVFEIVRRGTGVLNIIADSGVIVNSVYGYLSLARQFSAATIVKVATDEWDLHGDLA